MVTFMGMEGGWMDARLSGGPMFPGAIWTEPYIYFQPFPQAAAAAVPAAAPAAPANAVGEAAAAAASGGISSTKIPVSWGQRRIIGKVIDKIVHPLDDAGHGSELLCLSAGEPLFKDVPNDLVKIVANATVIYDIAQGGIVHPALVSVVWYDGTSDDQPADPSFAAAYGADKTPGYIGQMIGVLDFNSYEAFGNKRPGLTFFITDSGGFGGTTRTFQPWGHQADGSAFVETLDPDGKSDTIELTNGDLTAQRIQPYPEPSLTDPSYEWVMVRSTRGRPANQPMGQGWFVFEARNDHITTVEEHVVLGISEYQGPGLATDAHPFDGGRGGDESSLYTDYLSNSYLNNLTSGALTDLLTAPEGRWVMYAVRLDTMRMWRGEDGRSWDSAFVDWDDVSASRGNPVANTGGLPIDYMSGQTIYPAWHSRILGQSATFNFNGPFVNKPPGWTSGATAPVEPAELRNWGDVFIAAAGLCNLDPEHIVADVAEESEGGVIYDGLSWSDFVENSGKIANIDFYEDGEDIRIIQVPLESPTIAVDGIPARHRYIIDDEKGSINAERGGERHKPTVFELSYYDVSRQFQQSMVPARSEVLDSVKVERLSTPWVMTAEAAATRSAIALGKSEIEFEQFDQELPPIIPYFRLRPVDIVRFQEETRTIQVKVKTLTVESDWSLKVSYQTLFTTAADPTVPLHLEGIDANMPMRAIAITSPATFSRDEGTTAIATLTASGGAGAPYTWTMVGGADATLFVLTTGGVLSLGAGPDFEAPTDADADNVYEVTVRVADLGEQSATTQTINVTVVDVRELSITTPAAFSIPENTRSVAALTASGSYGARWEIIGGDDAAKFNLTSSGVLTFAPDAPDYEAPTDADANNVYEVEVKATDALANTATQTILVTVTNATPELVVTSSSSISVPENTT